MEKISDFCGRELQWMQPRMTEPYFELKAADEKVASLKFKNAFGSFAEGTFAGGIWTFKRQGFLSSVVTIREKGYENNLAVYRNNTWSEGGTLEIPDGVKYKVNSNYWNEQFEYTGESGNLLIQCTKISGFKLHARLEIFPDACELDKYPWMLLLGWYLAVMSSREGEFMAGLF
ncbi:MAG TPA: hypothetical protein PLJ84_03290 [Bacteroidales bacterium]|nr:hypothetical protein [Bacteroidales bacterium]HPT01595.1 hypothetical protein [Bacteroidales bacterium]